MPAHGPSAAPRPGGGFNAGMGQFGEHLDEAAMMKAMQQKGQQQQGASTAATPTPSHPQQQQAPPRDMGSFSDELFKRPFQDLLDGFRSLADLDTWLGIEPTPEQEQERARKEMMLKRFNQLTEAEQAVAKQRYQERLQKQKAEEEERELRRQQEEQQAQATLVVPSSSQKGPVGPGMSQKQKATNQLNWDRQRMDQGSKVG